MQPTKTKIALVLGAILLGASGASNAASGTYNITVSTLPDVVLTEVTALDYGASMFITSSQSCVMNATTPGDTPGTSTVNMQYTNLAAPVNATNYGDLTGAGCVNGTASGTPGLYKIGYVVV